MTTKDNIPVPNPPKAVQRGLGILNPPRSPAAGRNAIAPGPARIGDNAADFGSDESATQRIHVSLLKRNPVEEISTTEPLVLRNIRLKGHSGEVRPGGDASFSDAVSKVVNKQRRRVSTLAHDLDEDAVTKKIFVNRIVTVSPGNNDVHKANTHVRVETVNTAGGVPVTTGEYRNPLASERPTDLSALGNAIKASTKRRSVIPSLRDGLRKVLSLFSPNKNSVEGTPLIEPSEEQYSLGVNSYSADLYKEMRQAISAGTAGRRNNLPVPRFKYFVSRPPRIVLKGFLVRREKTTSLMLRGRAIHPLCVRDIMIFANKKKVLYLSSAARNDAGCIEFSADIPLSGDTSHILVVARHNEEVMGSQSLFVRKDD